MVKFLLILFAVVSLCVSTSWIIDGIKPSVKDEGGKIFGGFTFLVTVGLIVCYYFGFMYPIIVILGLTALMLISAGLGMSSEDTAIFTGSEFLFGYCTWVLGMLAAYVSMQLMLAEKWFTVVACLVAGFTVLIGVSIIRKQLALKSYSLISLVTFALLFFGSCFISKSYDVNHFALVVTDVIALCIGITYPKQYLQNAV